MSDFSHVAAPVPAAPSGVQSVQLTGPAPAAEPPKVSDTPVTADNVNQIVATIHDVVSRLVAVAHISDDEKRAHATNLAAAANVESPEERQAREQKDAQRAALLAQLSALDQQ